MERIYSVDRQFCNQFRYDSEFIARAEELGLVWSNPQAFIQSYNNREIGTIPGQYILRIIAIDSQPFDPSYDEKIYCIREEYKGRDPEIICSSIEGWTFRNMYDVADAFNTLQDSTGEPVFPTWDNILGFPFDKRDNIKNMMRCFINMLGKGFHPDNEVKVEITSKYVKFFRRDDVFSCYTYPALKDMKLDGKLLMELIDLWRESYNEEDVIRFTREYEEWTRSQMELPPFPIEQIFNSEYQNYKFHMYE